MITVANCSNLTEARLVQMLLEASGIPSFIPDEMMASAASPLFMNSSGVRVQVADEHAEEAQRIIDEQRIA